MTSSRTSWRLWYSSCGKRSISIFAPRHSLLTDLFHTLRYSSPVKLPFPALHGTQEGTRFSGSSLPPRLLGKSWSISVASQPQYAHGTPNGGAETLNLLPRDLLIRFAFTCGSAFVLSRTSDIFSRHTGSSQSLLSLLEVAPLEARWNFSTNSSSDHNRALRCLARSAIAALSSELKYFRLRRSRDLGSSRRFR